MEVTWLLVENCANIDTPDRWIWTPLYYATYGSHPALVDFLLDNGASPSPHTPLGTTPCYLAASREDIENVKRLIDSNCDLKLTPRNKRTVSHFAA